MSSICPISACSSIKLHEYLSDFKRKAIQISEKFAPIICSVASAIFTYCLVPAAWAAIAVPLVALGAGAVTYYWFGKGFVSVSVPLPPGAPRGISNIGGANCWVNTLFQMIHADPILRSWFLSDACPSEACPTELLAFRNFIRAYDKAYAEGLSVVNSNSQELRTCLASLMRQPGIDFDAARQEDPTEGWMVIHNRLPELFKARLLQTRHYVAEAGQPPVPNWIENRTDLLPPTAHFSLPIIGVNPTLNTLMEAFCNGGADGSYLDFGNVRYLKSSEAIEFLTAPLSLWIDFKRYNGGEHVDISLPDRYDLQLRDRTHVSYQLTSFAVHSGRDNCGHYTAFRKGPGDGRWYQISDSQVIAISDEQMRTESLKAYFVHYSRIISR